MRSKVAKTAVFLTENALKSPSFVKTRQALKSIGERQSLDVNDWPAQIIEIEEVWHNILNALYQPDE